MRRSVTLSLLASAAVLAPQAAEAVIPYTPVPTAPGMPIVGPGVTAPDGVYGKEYSHDLDFSVVGPVLDPQQVIAWDGIGGTADTVDFSGTRPDWEPDQQVDALANSRDALFDETIRDEAHLIFSHDDVITVYGTPGGGPALVPVPSGGPVFLSNGNAIGGAGEVSIEEAGSPTQYTWASLPEVNGMPEPIDVDGLEVWGPEPRRINEPDAPVVGDSDKYSLDTDLPSGVSVWNASGTPYIAWPTVVATVESLLGPVPPTAFSLRDEHQGRQAINLDALMVSDTIEEKDVFHEDIGFPVDGAGAGLEELKDQNGFPFEPIGLEGERRGDSIVFSIRQIIDPADPDGYYSTGSELFVLDSLTGPAGAKFLEHGGHIWDHDYALAELAVFGFEDIQFEFGVIDINAIEAIGEDVFTEPTKVLGDANGDGVLNTLDIDPFVKALTDPAGYAAMFPGVDICNVDINMDGIVSTLDIDPFVALLTGGSPVATSAPEPGAAMLVLLAAAGALTRRTRVA